MSEPTGEGAGAGTGEDKRTRQSTVAGDRASLTGFLDFQRETLAMKCQGLSGDQLRLRAVPTSALTLLGLVRHTAEVERSWFGVVLAGEDSPFFWAKSTGEPAAFEVEGADVDEAFAVWHQACEKSRAAADAVQSLEHTVEFRGRDYSLRYILTHMIEEYARHNGHADLLREAIDGTVGE
jgi:uncharacterized damage-inducible protein DinB